MARITITATSFLRDDRLTSYARARLAGHELNLAEPATPPFSGTRLLEVLAHCEAAVVGRETLPRELLVQLPSLRFLSVYGVGFDNIDARACHDLGIKLLVAEGVNASAVAEHTVGLMLAACRNIARNDRELRSGHWRKNGGYQLGGKKVAIIGCGHVGSRVAHLLRAFGCELMLCDIRDVTPLATATGGQLASLDECLAQADLVSLHVPLTAQTHGMIDASALARMRQGSLLVNTSRGKVVQLADLKAALRAERLAGAALDVYESEPLVDPELTSLPQVVLTPHTAGNAREAVWAMGRAAIDMLVAQLT